MLRQGVPSVGRWSISRVALGGAFGSSANRDVSSISLFDGLRIRPVRLSGTVYCHKAMRKSHSEVGFRSG
jgi:hypothetical protein